MVAKWEATLFQNVEKEHSEQPDFKGALVFGVDTYDVVAWLREVKKGSHAGRPYLSMQLTPTDDSGAVERANIALWEKRYRTAETDPHFKGKESLNGEVLKFSARIKLAGSLHAVQLSVERLTADDEEMGALAKETQRRLAAFTGRGKGTAGREAAGRKIVGVKSRPRRGTGRRGPLLDAVPHRRLRIIRGGH